MSEMIAPAGTLKIADEVISQVASTAVLEVEGIANMASHFTRKKGITLKMENGRVHINVEIAVIGGTKIQDVAQNVQNKVKNAIETMTGFTVDEVNVNVTGLIA